MMRVLRLCVLIALAAVVAAGCGGGDSASEGAGEPISLVALTKAAGTSAEATSGRFAFSMEMSFPGAGEPFAFSGEGAFDKSSERASFTVDMSSLASLLGGLFSGLAGPDAKNAPDFGDPAGWKIDAIQDGAVTYVRFPALAEQLPAGKSWIRAKAGDSGSGPGFDFTQFQDLASNDPRAVLDFLRGLSGDVDTVGVEELRGVTTTHYRTTLDSDDYANAVPEGKRADLGPLLDEVAKGLGAVPVDIWLDEEGLVRKLALTFSAAQAGAKDSADGSVSFELWDYGETVAIDLPPAAEVVDAAVLGP